MQEFCRRTEHMIRELYPKIRVFVDDVSGKGPSTIYNGETIEGNTRICRFVYEGLTVLHHTLILLGKASVTVSGNKFIGATPALELVGVTVTIMGTHISHHAMSKFLKWPECQSVTEVRGFLGTVGVVRKWICNFAKIAKPLTLLTKKESAKDFEWSEAAQKSMTQLKELAAVAPPLKKIDYNLASKVVQ